MENNTGTIGWLEISKAGLPPLKPPQGNFYADSVNVLIYRGGHAIMEGTYCYTTKIWSPYKPTHFAYINKP